MRSILLLGITLCTSQLAAAQQPVIIVEESTPKPAGTEAKRRLSVDYVPPADGGLGSTMTLAQQGKIAANRKAEEIKIVTTMPAGEPRPALKYRLWKPDFTLRPGSAALHFGRALLMWKDLPGDFRTNVSQWSTGEGTPDREERKRAIETLDNVYKELHLLAISEDRAWDHRLRDITGPALYAYLFPEIQQSRELARLLSMKIQYQLSQSDFDGAVETLQDGFRLASFIGQGETLIQQLVGMAIEGLMLENVEALIQRPDSPNMYWALASLPRPLIEVSKSIEFELGSIHRVIPALAEAEHEPHDEAYWNTAWAEVVNNLEGLGGLDEENKLLFSVIGAAGIAPAKSRLVQLGMKQADVEAMPALRALLLDASLEIRRMSDDLTKTTLLPYVVGAELGKQEQQVFVKWLTDNTFKSAGAAIVGLLFPAVQAAEAAGIRQEFVVNRLMTIEALRLHAHEHDGVLPDGLEQLTPVPALPNPFTGNPFSYEREVENGNVYAVLTAEVPPQANHLKQVTVRFENR